MLSLPDFMLPGAWSNAVYDMLHTSCMTTITLCRYTRLAYYRPLNLFSRESLCRLYHNYFVLPKLRLDA